jgi:hypothetical protein
MNLEIGARCPRFAPVLWALTWAQPAMKDETNPLSVLLDASNSLFRNILHISPLNSKILREFLRNSLIPKDRGQKKILQYRVSN